MDPLGINQHRIFLLTFARTVVFWGLHGSTRVLIYGKTYCRWGSLKPSLGDGVNLDGTFAKVDMFRQNQCET